MKKLNIFYLSVLLIFISKSSDAQNGYIWAYCYGGLSNDRAHCVIQTFDGGYLVAGSTESNTAPVFGNHGGKDIWLVKLDQNGIIAWTKCLGGTGHDEAFSVIQCPDSNYIIAGSTNSNDGDVSNNHGGYDCWIVKLYNDGTSILWQKCFGGSSEDFAFSIIKTFDGNYVFTGQTQSTDGDIVINYGSDDFWEVKINDAGTKLWQKTLGGPDEEHAHQVIETKDSSLLLVGHTTSSTGMISGNHGAYDYWINKYDSSGTLYIWSYCFGGSNDEYGRAVYETSNGDLIVAGRTNSTNSGNVNGNHSLVDDFWILRLSATGSLLWKKCFGGTGYEQAFSITSANNGFAIAGLANTNSGDVSGNHGSDDVWVIQINDSGNLIRQHSYGGSSSEQARSIIQTSDGNFIIAGWTNSNDNDVSLNNGLEDFWIIKTDSVMTSVGIHSNRNEIPSLTIFPNPFHDQTVIRFSENTFSNNQNLNFTMTDLQGRIVQHRTITALTQFTLERKEIIDGIYFYKIENESKLIYSGKFLIY